MARTKEDILQDIRWEQDSLNRALEQRRESLLRIPLPDRRKSNWDNLSTIMAQGMLEESAERLYQMQVQPINARIARLQAELENLPEYKYENLLSQKISARSESEFRNLASEFRKLAGYDNSRQLADDCEKSANNIVEKNREKQYCELLARKRIVSNEKDFNLLAREFRDMKGYKDAIALAEECDKLAAKAKEEVYEKLLKAKKRADSKSEPNISDYRELARQFSEMGSNYKDAATLSKECERIAFAQEQKKQYNNLLSRKSKAQSEDDFRILANDFRAMGDYQDAAALEKECETRYQKLKSERIHAEYTNALTTMKWLKKMKTRKPDNLRKLEKEWEKLARKFMTNADYKDASALAKECIKKSETACAKAKRIEILNEKIPRIVGLILQISVFVSFLYILFGTEIVRGSVQNIISILLSNNNPDIVYYLPLILPLFFYALAICFIGSVFIIIKKKRVNYLFYIAAILIQIIILATWIKEYVGEVLPFRGILLIVICMAIIIIPGSIVGMMKRKTATITLLTFFIIMLMSRYGYYSGWFDNYREKRNYADGMAAVKYGNFLSQKWGFMDEYSKEIIPCIYSDVLSFSEGLAAVRIDNKENGKWGFIGKDGNEIASFKYDAVESFSEGLAKVRIGNAENGKWGFIDRNGTEVVPCKYNSIGVFTERLALVNNDNKWGFIDKNGKEVIPCKYNSAESFSEGLALVNSDSKWGFIDKFGRIIISLKYDAAKSFSDGYAQVGEAANTGVRGWNFKWGLIDKRENLIVPYKYFSVGSFVGDLAEVSIRTSNTVAVSYKPDQGGSGHSPRVYNRMGVVNKKGQEVIPCEHYSISIRENEIYVITISGQNIYFDKSGNRVRRSKL